MTSLNRAVRQRTPFTVVRVRRIKHRAVTPIVGPRPARAARAAASAEPDLSGLILYGQA